MSNSYNDHQVNGKSYERSRENGRGDLQGSGRGPGRRDRDTGGFRIRLSDNEMRSAKLLQEAFDLRSTVAVLGFSVRTLAQMLEDGKLTDIVELSKNQSNKEGNHQGHESPNQSRRNRFNNEAQGDFRRGTKPNPFARPDKPQPVIEKEEITPPQDQSTESNQGNSTETANQSKEIQEETKSNEIINSEDQKETNSSSEG